MVQNIDPVYFLQPVITILLTVTLVVYWHYRRSFTRAVLIYSALAYIGAIAAKVIAQAATFNSFQARFSDNAAVLGAYFGAQTLLQWDEPPKNLEASSRRVSPSEAYSELQIR